MYLFLRDVRSGAQGEMTTTDAGNFQESCDEFSSIHSGAIHN